MLKNLFKPKKAEDKPQTKDKSKPRHKAAAKDAVKDTGEGSANTAPQPKRRSKKAARPESPPWQPSDWKVPEQEGKTRFLDLDLHPSLLRGIADLNFEYCSPIQAAVLPSTLQGHDAIGKAQTGTGKTAAFLITVMNDLLNNPVEERYIGEPRALVIAPTRELVAQIAEDARDLGKHTGLKVITLIGGMDYQKQQQQVERGLTDIVVATPGRLLDFYSRKDLFLDQVEMLVLDEADRMLDMGFIPQVKRIIRATPQKTRRQTLLFSATFTPDIIALTEQWTHEPVNVEIEPESVATDSVDQRVYMMSASDKFTVLLNLLRQDEVESVIVFANRRDQTRKLHEKLRRGGIPCGILSGEIPQNKRTRTLQMFKDGELKVLVATDVAGRGIHVDGISHVVNYNLPEDPDDYVHRIGRTGRAGAKGVSISLACEDDAFMLPDIETLLGERLPCEQVPEHLLPN